MVLYTFPIRRLTDSNSNEMTWTYRGPTKRGTFFKEITKAVQDRKSLHLVPSARNFPAVDSILYDPNAVLTCIQITMNKDHAMVVSGLQLIQSWLKLGTSLEGLCPKTTRPWRFLYSGEQPIRVYNTQSPRNRGSNRYGVEYLSLS